MKKNIFFILGVSFFLTSCVNTTQHNNRVEIQEFSKKVFEGYKYEYEPGIVKSNAEMSNILISKNDMNKSDFNLIEGRIIKLGWIKKDYFDGLHIYCYGSHNKLGVLYPEKNEYFDRRGSKIILGDFNDWLIYYVYNDEGVSGCN